VRGGLAVALIDRLPVGRGCLFQLQYDINITLQIST